MARFTRLERRLSNDAGLRAGQKIKGAEELEDAVRKEYELVLEKVFAGLG